MSRLTVIKIITAVLLASVAVSCATNRKLSKLRKNEAGSVQLALGNQPDYLPDIKDDIPVAKDTLTVRDDEGREMIIMKAIKDEETGEMVANEVIRAATITARFRNVAERNGKVDLAFQVIVPPSMMDSKWQLRFYPDMFVLGDSIRLDPVIITGAAYRKAQLRGYELYDRFLSRIVRDSTKFINVRQLEIFLKRYIPQIYAYKGDSTFVSEEVFYSAYGVSQRQAVEHYTNKFARNMNERRKNRMDKMYRKYVKVPIVTESIRLDSVIVSSDGEFVYNYVQTINTRPKLRKVDIILSGDIYEEAKRIYAIPKSEPLTFYISSISAFTDNTERYLTKVIERRASANTEAHIDFKVGKSDVVPDFGNNAYEIELIKRTLSSLVRNEVFDLDSIIVSATASPEGSYALNSSLAQKRSESVSAYFEDFMVEYRDSLEMTAGLVENMDETWTDTIPEAPAIRFTPRCIPENWTDLDDLVLADVVMNDGQKKLYQDIRTERNPDVRESRLRQTGSYTYIKETLYPKLRTVKFNFYLHRKGMVKDTVHTTVLDSTYMRGVQALRDMDYAGALLLLKPYNDFNTAVAYIGTDRNANAMRILEKLEKTDKVNYLLAVLYSRQGDFEKAVECYVKSCRQNPSYVFRGNLDPEISVLIKTYGLNSESDDEVFQ